jgi:hypothetical protein
LLGKLIFLDVGFINLQEVEYWGMERIELAQTRNRWQAFVTAVMNLRVP